MDRADRVAPLRLPKADPLDFMVVLALAVIPFSYYLGFDLDWGSEAQAGTAAYSTFQAGSLARGPAAAFMEPASIADPRGGLSQEDLSGWSEMIRRLEREAVAYPGRVAIYLKDIKRDRTWTYHPDDLFPSASLIKVPVMAAVFDKIHRGELSLDSRLVMHRRDRVGGSGSIKWFPDGTSFAVRELLERMIDESDNTAARMLIATAGFGYLQQEFPKMGLLYTEIYPEGMSLRSSPVRYENYTTAREMSMLLEKIYRGELVDPYSDELMLEFLKRHHARARLAKRLPTGWEIAHKTGLLRGACHDSAIIFTPRGDYVLTVLTGKNRSYGRAKDFIAQLGRITYAYYKADQFLARRAEGGLLD